MLHIKQASTRSLGGIAQRGAEKLARRAASPTSHERAKAFSLPHFFVGPVATRHEVYQGRKFAWRRDSGLHPRCSGLGCAANNFHELRQRREEGAATPSTPSTPRSATRAASSHDCVVPRQKQRANGFGKLGTSLWPAPVADVRDDAERICGVKLSLSQPSRIGVRHQCHQRRCVADAQRPSSKSTTRAVPRRDSRLRRAHADERSSLWCARYLTSE